MPIEWPSASASQSPPSVDGDSSDGSLSYPSSEASFDSDDQRALIQEEWEESMRQLEMVFSVILLPFLGKWWGRKFAFWALDRYRTLGWTRQFFGLAAVASTSTF